MRLIPLLTAIVIATASSQALASDAEREILARLDHELSALTPLIAEAERNANTTERVKFRYDWLRSDIAAIRDGLRQHIEADIAEPRRYEPLRGDYRR